MKKKILINALYSEEKRVAIVEGETLVDFYVESAGKEHLRGNIYKAFIVRVEQGLQAAFVDFGQKKHGFLQLREVMPEFYKEKADSRRARIQDVLAKGMELIVQVEKDERDTKGASLTTYISLPGRYIVMMPGQKERVGISRKIEEKEDRNRLKDIFTKLKTPKNMGFILRTAGIDTTTEELSNDLKYLTKLWAKIQTESKKTASPALIYKEQDIAVRTVRDYLTTDVGEVLIDDPGAYKAVKEFLKKTAPWQKINVKLYKEKKPIFVRFGIEDQISRIHERHVHLPSRGYVVIDKTEALTAIDVNSGRSRKEENIESTALKTNMEAADEIARQLRIRDIGGLIVIDFIDMESSKNRREVENRLKDALSTDKAHTEITGISKFGIVEMTRERMRTAFAESVSRKCEVCGGTGTVRTDEMAAVAALRDVQMRLTKGGIKAVECRLTVESLNYIVNNRRSEVEAIESEFKMPLTLLADPKVLPGQYLIKAEGEKPEPKAEHRHEQKREPRHEPKQQQKREPRPEHKREARHEPHPKPAEEGQAGAAAELAGEEPTVQGEGQPEQPGEQKQGVRRRRKRSRGRRRGRRRTPAEAGQETQAEGPEGQAEGQPAEADASDRTERQDLEE